MKIQTKPFGEIEIEESDLIHFPSGILAFENLHQYVILKESKEAPFSWLQSLDDPGLAFLIMNPMDIVDDYQPEIMKHEIRHLFDTEDNKKLELWCIITIPKNQPEKLTINLQGPIIVYPEKKLGGQFISNDDRHRVRMPLVDLAEAGKIA